MEEEVEEEEAPYLPLIPFSAAKEKNSVDRKTRAKSRYEYMCI